MRGKRVEGKPEDPGGQRREARTTPPGEASVSKRVSPPRNDRAPAQVRIIGGQWKRTPLAVVDAPGLRPSPDRVRETVFNWLAHLVPDLDRCSGLDLYAGTGALGFELASRGARRVVLVERNAVVEAQLQRVKQKLGAESVSIVRGEGLSFARAAAARSFDVVFLDPPFDAGLMAASLEAAERLIGDGGLIYAESDVPIAADAAGALGLRVVREGRAGQVHFHLLQRA